MTTHPIPEPPVKTTTLSVLPLEDRLVPAGFTWQMAERFTDTNGNSHPELHYDKAYIRANQFEVTLQASGPLSPETLAKVQWAVRDADTDAVVAAPTGGTQKALLAEGV